MSPDQLPGYKALTEAIGLFKDYPEIMNKLLMNRPEIHKIIEILIHSQESPEDIYRLSAALSITEDFDEASLSAVVSSQERGENPNIGSIIRYTSSTFSISAQYNSHRKGWFIVDIKLRGDWPEDFDEANRDEETERFLVALREHNPDSFHGVLSPAKDLVVRLTGAVAVNQSTETALMPFTAE